MPKPRRPRRSWPVGLCAAYLAAVLVGVVLEAAVAERWWLGTLVTFAPQALWLLPLPFLLLAALLGRDRRALGLLGGALVPLPWLLGLQVHLPTRRPADLRVMTFNIAHGRDGIETVIEAIRRTQPDVVCLQEVNGTQGAPDPLPMLEKALPEYDLVREKEVALGSRWKRTATETIRYPLADHSRVALAGTFATPRGPLTVVVAHLHTAATGESFTRLWRRLPWYLGRAAQVRRVQAETAIRWCEGRPEPTILCGDFNTPPRGMVYGRLTEKMTDSFAACGNGLGWSYSASRPLLRIDYVFCGNGLEPLQAWTLPWSGSDHLPLVAELDDRR